MKTKEYYIDIAKANPEKHKKYPGYVYIGPGNEDRPHADFFRRDGVSCVSCVDGGELKHNYRGNCHEIEYYAVQKTWEEKIGQSLDSIINPKKEITLSEIKTQYEEATKLIGKTIKSRVSGCKGVVTKVVFAMHDGLDSQLTKDFYRDNGYVIGVYFDIFNYPHTQIELCEPVIKVKNTDGQEFEGQYDKNTCTWTFGCAKIDGLLIQHLDIVVKPLDKGKSVESVTIGKGIFPVATIREMRQIQLDESSK